jgi:hypothetical protein
MLPSPTVILGAILAVILSFGAGYYKGSSDESADQAIAIANANTQARAKEQKIVLDHHEITKSTLGEKDAIEKNRLLFMAQYAANTFGLRQPSTSLSIGTNPTLGIGSQALRFSTTDAEFLNNFAASCEITEAERNEVILKYEALRN